MLSTDQPRGLDFKSQVQRLHTVFSDYKPLKNFFEGEMKIAKLDRWSLELQEFDFNLEFIEGKLNKIADAISRLKNEGLYVKHSNKKPIK